MIDIRSTIYVLGKGKQLPDSSWNPPPTRGRKISRPPFQPEDSQLVDGKNAEFPEDLANEIIRTRNLEENLAATEKDSIIKNKQGNG